LFYTKSSAGIGNNNYSVSVKSNPRPATLAAPVDTFIDIVESRPEIVTVPFRPLEAAHATTQKPAAQPIHVKPFENLPAPVANAPIVPPSLTTRNFKALYVTDVSNLFRSFFGIQT
jgi:hypothetical protein